MTDVRRDARQILGDRVNKHMQKQWIDEAPARPLADGVPAYALPLLLAVLALLILRGLVIPAPILASDEYAYNVLSRYLRLDDLFVFDPQLQHIANPLYLALHHLWIQIGGGNGVLVTRFVHACEWGAASLVLYATFAGITGRRAAALGAGTMLLLPTSFYTLTVMPETELALLATLLGYVLIRWLPLAPLRAAAVAGALCGTALLFKPHAVAWVPATLVLACGAGWFYRHGRSGALAIGGPVLLFLGGWYTSFLLGWRIGAGEWEPNPTAALGLKFYGGYMAKAGNSGFWEQNAIQMARYVFAHLLVISILFLPALAALFSLCRQAWVERGARPNQLLLAAAFVLLMLGSHLMMVGYFSASAGEKDSFEALRVHGRYMASVLVFLPFFYFWFLGGVQRQAIRMVAAVALLLCIVFYFTVFRSFKIYPWDYPELFAFFHYPNSYGWSFKGDVSIGYVALAVCVLAPAIAWMKPALFRATMTLQLLLLLLIGHVQVQQWLNTHMKLNGDYIAMADALGRSLQPNKPGDGLLIGDVRYGNMSYILFNLGVAPRVLVREPGATISAEDVENANWVVTGADYDIQFPHRSLVRFGPLALYPLNATSPKVFTPEKPDWNGETFVVRPGSVEGTGSALQGFNAPEEWGAWTARPSAEIELPYFIEGDVVITLFGWVIEENLDNDLRVTIGDDSAGLRMRDRGADYRLELHVGQRADRIKLAIPVFRPHGSARNMGAGIARIEIARKPAADR